MKSSDLFSLQFRFLRGTCGVTGCPFSHKIAKDKMPVCLHFLRGACSRDNCPYRHVKVSKDATICRDFLDGYCPKGEAVNDIFTHQEYMCFESFLTGKCLHLREAQGLIVLHTLLCSATSNTLWFVLTSLSREGAPKKESAISIIHPDCKKDHVSKKIFQNRLMGRKLSAAFSPLCVGAEEK